MDALRSGFRVVLRQPALILAEIAWRWSFGAAAWVLVVLSFRRVLAGIDITRAEYLLARRSDIFLVADACARILYQALPGFVRAATTVVPALALIWIFAATLGRAATLKTLIGEKQERRDVGPGATAGVAADLTEDSVPAGAFVRGKILSLLFLNVLRVLLLLTTMTAVIGTMILAGIAFPAQGADPTTAALIWVILVALAAFFWTVINWFLALAPIWIFREGHGPFRAIADSLALSRRHPAACVSAAWWFGFLRSVWLLAALIAGAIAASAFESTRVVAAVSLLIALIYFAVTDFLYIARLAAFVSLADQSPQLSAASLQPIGPEPQPVTPES